jgi:hypothetical protein
MGTMTPLSVMGGLLEFGFAPASTLLMGPGLLAEWFCSPFKVSALVWAKSACDPIAPALIAAAAAPKSERRPTDGLSFSRIVVVSFPVFGEQHIVLRPWGACGKIVFPLARTFPGLGMGSQSNKRHRGESGGRHTAPKMSRLATVFETPIVALHWGTAVSEVRVESPCGSFSGSSTSRPENSRCEADAGFKRPDSIYSGVWIPAR